MPRYSAPRALFIVLTDNPGGAERIAITQANRLAERQWDVEWHVLGPRAPTSFSGVNLLASCETHYGAGPLWIELLALPLGFKWRAYDLVVTTHIYTNGAVAFLRRLKLLRTRRLVTRESTTVFDRFTGARRLLFRLLYALYGSQDLIVAQTESMANHIAPYLSARSRRLVRVLPNPIDYANIDRRAVEPLAPATCALLEGGPNVLVCGSLTAVKQPELALEVFAIARKDVGNDLRLVFVGDGPLRSNLQSLVGKMGLDGAVLFLGQQANPYAVMRRCQYGLLTSSREGFPNVVLEMMACGLKSIVMSPCAGDLATLSGVRVSQDFSSQALAGLLSDAIRSNEDCGRTFRSCIEGRSVDWYLAAVLGEDQQ